jgi:hypothetical protein
VNRGDRRGRVRNSDSVSLLRLVTGNRVRRGIWNATLVKCASHSLWSQT